jgi:hypothetical protein
MEKAGMDVQTLRNRPDEQLIPELEMLLGHFLSLGRFRPPSMSGVPSPIPLTQIESFYRVFKVSEYMELEEFASWMIQLDHTLMDYYFSLQKIR